MSGCSPENTNARPPEREPGIFICEVAKAGPAFQWIFWFLKKCAIVYRLGAPINGTILFVEMTFSTFLNRIARLGHPRRMMILS